MRFTIYSLFSLVIFFTLPAKINAQCTSAAGEISQSSPILCYGATLQLILDGNAVLDSNDVMRYYAFTGASPQTGTVLAISSTPEFAFIPAFASPFNVVAIVGNSDGGSGVDWSDPCLSISPPALIGYLNPINLSVAGGVLTCAIPALSMLSNVSGGQPPYLYSWSGPGITPSNMNLASPSVGTQGQYCLTVTDANGCAYSDCADVLINQPSFTVTAEASGPLGCPNNTTTLVVNVVPSGQYTYNWWGPNGINSTQNNLITSFPGSYTVTVTNSVNGCTGTATVIVNQQAPFTLVTVPTQPTCAGLSNGSINLTVNGGTPPFTYDWNNDGPENPDNDAEDLVNLPSGNITVTVTDANGCMGVKATLIPFTQPINSNPVTTAPNCTEPTSGSINWNVNGGTPPYFYNWSNGLNTPSDTSLAEGIYSVTVIDQNGCSGVRSASLPLLPNYSIIETVTPATCPGGTNGAIDLQITGGTGPFTFIWTNSETTQNISGLSAGTYTVTVTSATACTGTKSIDVFEQGTFTVDVAITPPSCFGKNDGSLAASVTNGTGPFTYLWSTGVTTSIISGLNPGTYTVTVVDGQGCTVSKTAILPNGPEIIDIQFVIQPPACPGAINGSIDITATGGTPPYAYEWSTSSTTQDQVNLPGGTYSVTVTESSGCKGITEIVLPEGPQNLVLDYVPTSTSCSGNDDGAINLIVDGGIAPYSFIWSNGSSTEDLAGLSSGSYSVTVTDFNGCTNTQSAIVPNGVAVLTIDAQTTPTICSGSPTGSITVSVNGGTLPYNFDWLDVSGTNNAANRSNLLNGSYIILVSDANGCAAESFAIVDAGPQVLDLSASITTVQCFGGNTGAINLTTTGGTQPFSFLWNNSIVTEDLNNLSSGTYTVTVSDANFCSNTASFTIQQPFPLGIIATTTNLQCQGTATGSIDLTVSGGTAPYEYSWSFGGATTQDVTGLMAGSYVVTVTDATGCTAVRTFVITQPPPIIITGAVLQPNCVLDLGAITTTVSGGQQPYTYVWSNSEITPNIGNLPPGQYSVTITDSKGCTQTQTFLINNQPPAINVNLLSQNFSCSGNNYGQVLSTVTSGTPPYAFLWNNGANTNNLNSVPPGSYSVTVTDNNGCTATNSTTVNAAQPPSFSASVSANACGEATITTQTNDTGPHTILINGDAYGGTGGSQDFEVTENGVYTVVFLSGSCTDTVELLIAVQPVGDCALITGRVTDDQNVDCLATNDAGISNIIVQASGATGTYYSVTDPDGTYFMEVQPGSYMITANLPGPGWSFCDSMLVVGPLAAGETEANVDFPLTAPIDCPNMSVTLATPLLRRCFNNYYVVSYCNIGTAPAANAYFLLQMDPFFENFSSSKPFTNLGNNLLRFDLGNLTVGQCGSIVVFFGVSCNAIIGQTHCTEVIAYPHGDCTPPNAQWSGASLEVTAKCENNEARFSIKNNGTGQLSTPLGYIVIEDAVMRMAQPNGPALNPGETVDIAFPANGSTWRVQAEQEPLHPGSSHPSAILEGCALPGAAFSTGFVNQLPLNDDDPWIDIDCKQNVGSWDPNDKQGFPTGYGPNHQIEPGTELTYHIRFQNTGSDTAFNILIADTLDAFLNPMTLVPGASSHPYRFDMYGEGIVQFIFNNIMLPDSNVNELLSHGFVQYKIKPRDGAALGSQIHNRAGIYFDFNEPVITNTTQHEINVNFLISSLWRPQLPDVSIQVIPNPVQDIARIEIKGLQGSQEINMQIFDSQGRLVHQQWGLAPVLELNRGDLPGGQFFVKLSVAGKTIATGKIALK